MTVNQQPAQPLTDIIDNRQHSIIDQTSVFLDDADSAHFAIGYLFLAGLTPMIDQLSELKELRILIGNTSSPETIDQIAETYRQQELIEESVESLRYPKRPLIKRMEIELSDNIRSSLSLMDQTDETERAIHTLIQMLEAGRLKVRMYTKGRLEARAYIFDFATSANLENAKGPGVGIVGSTNLSLAAVSCHTELNVIARGAQNHAELTRWFDDLWKSSRDFDQRLLEELRQCWAVIQVRPYDIYMKSLFTLIHDRLEESDVSTSLWDEDIFSKLADFQRVAVEQAVLIILNYGGAFVADVVGLGKSFVGAAIVKHFERSHRCRALIICPAPLVDMWDRYNEVYELNARVLSMGMLRDNPELDENYLLDNELFQNRDFVLIDESHNFRHSNTQRYRILEQFLSDGKRCCFLTATPRNKSAWDVYYQLKLFHQDDRTDIPVSPPNLMEYFRGVEQGRHRLNELLSNILIRRTRRDILRWYGFDAETNERIDPHQFDKYRTGEKKAYVIVAGQQQYFPTRNLETIEYSIDEAYQGLYEEIRLIIGSAGRGQLGSSESEGLTYARYGLWNYVLPRMQNEEHYSTLQSVGANLCGLMRVLLFKRFESSVQAFRETISRLLKSHGRFRLALEEGIVPAGEDAQNLLNDPDEPEVQNFLDNMRSVSDRYSASDFNIPLLISHINHDISQLERILEIVEPVTPEKDAKLQTLLDRITQTSLSEGKCLIFTQYTDTAQYLYDNLVSATGRQDIDVVYGNDKSRLKLVGRFAPIANPEYRKKSQDPDLNILVATDSLSEGLNLQDCDKIINYDLHWNPVRLIQRFGRIDRIGSSHDEIYGFNFLPEAGIEQQLGLQRVLENRIREIHETIGEDVAILNPTEQLNENAMYAIYEQSGNALEELEGETDTVFDLNEAMEMFRQMRTDDPEEYDRIANLPHGIRSAMCSSENRIFVHCKAGKFQQLYLADSEGQIITQDLQSVLSRIQCEKDTETQPLSANHNDVVMNVKHIFTEEVKQRTAERHHTVSLGHGQKYVLRELRQQFSDTHDEDKKARINMLEQSFRNSQSTVITRELNRLRKNNVAGDHLYSTLLEIYNHHGLRDRNRETNATDQHQLTPTLICSESLIV